MLPDSYVIHAAANLSVPQAKPSTPQSQVSSLSRYMQFLVGDLIKFEG